MTLTLHILRTGSGAIWKQVWRASLIGSYKSSHLVPEIQANARIDADALDKPPRRKVPQKAHKFLRDGLALLCPKIPRTGKLVPLHISSWRFGVKSHACFVGLSVIPPNLIGEQIVLEKTQLSLLDCLVFADRVEGVVSL